MSLDLFTRGFGLGFVIAAPVGPIGVLCIRRTLNHGRGLGLSTGLGAATADAFYGAIAAFGLTSISGFLQRQEIWLAPLGGIILLWLGFNIFRSKPVERHVEDQTMSLPVAFLSTFLLTVSNPATILSFGAAFTRLGFFHGDHTFSGACWMVLGVFLGSGFWWLLLSHGVASLQHRLNLRSLVWINRFSGLIILAFAVTAFVPKSR